MDERGVLGIDLHRDDRHAVLEIDGRDVADLDPGDVHRLALAGRERLAGAQLGLELELVEPTSGTQLGSSAACSERIRPTVRIASEDEQDDDRREVARVLSDRPLHGYGPQVGLCDCCRRAR